MTNDVKQCKNVKKDVISLMFGRQSVGSSSTKNKYHEILDEMADSIAEHLESLPEGERNRRLKVLASSSFGARKRLARMTPLKHETSPILARSRKK